MNETLYPSSTPVLHTQLCTCTPKPVVERTFSTCMDQCAERSVVGAGTIVPAPTFQRMNEDDVQHSNGLLTRAGAWLRGRCVTKRLRVAETISLGEKRFVAIVSVEGQEFLIGGGSAGMSLLAQLGDNDTRGNDLVSQMQQSGGAR